MIAYNKTWLANLRLQKQVKQDMEQGRISKAEFDAITQKYPAGFYTPNIFTRAGLFILTIVIVVFSDALLSFIGLSSRALTGFGWLLFLGLLSWGGLEAIINTKQHFRSGVDDALIFAILCQFGVGIGALTSNSSGDVNYTVLSFIGFVIALLLALRFINLLAAAVSCLSLLAFIFFACTQFIHGGLTLAPFIMMAASAGLYFFAKRNLPNIKAINYQNCLTLVSFISLLVLYAAGNYFVIQTLTNEYAGIQGKVSFGFIFWTWTMLVPLVYIFIGINKKDAILLRTGLPIVAAAVITFKTYHHVLPVDQALTLAGGVLLMVVYLLVRYLKTPKHGFTYAGPENANMLDQLKVESLIVAETFAHAPTAPANDGTRFGGGDFGGGGSSGDF